MRAANSFVTAVLQAEYWLLGKKSQLLITRGKFTLATRKTDLTYAVQGFGLA